MTSEAITRLLNGLPRQILFPGVTPVTRMYNLEKLAGAGPLYIKRDDLNGVGPGGNKVRPLEYLLGEALARKNDTIIASGQANSNLCSIAASACCKLGVKCILVHNSNRPEKPAGHALLNYLSGVEEHYIGEVSEKQREIYISELADVLTKNGKKPYIIENGATTIHGSVGYIHLPLELAALGSEYSITDLFVPGGNGGLASGIVLGTMLLGNPFHVHVITVENSKEELHRIIKELVEGMKEYLGTDIDLPLDCAMTIHEDYRGGGWGIPTKEADAMIQTAANQEGIFLERVYTSKTVWGMYDLLKKEKIKTGGACVLHSGGFAALFNQY